MTNRAVERSAPAPANLMTVRRVVFIATPQRGSYLAGPGLVRRLAQRMISLPAALARSGTDLLTSGFGRKAGIERLPTSSDNMSPGHPFIVPISKIPIAPGIAVNLEQTPCAAVAVAVHE